MPGTVNIFRAVAYDSTNPAQPPELMAVPDEFYPIIGKLVIQWAVMEQETELLTSALLELNGTLEPGWQKRPFNKRWALFQTEFVKFAASEPGLIKEMKEIDRLVKLAKPVRDGLAHQRMLMGMDEGGNFLRFEVENKRYPWSRQYYHPDLHVALLGLIGAAGRIYRLMVNDHPTADALPGKSLLQRLPNMDHRRFPIPRAR